MRIRLNEEIGRVLAEAYSKPWHPQLTYRCVFGLYRGGSEMASKRTGDPHIHRYQRRRGTGQLGVSFILNDDGDQFDCQIASMGHSPTSRNGDTRHSSACSSCQAPEVRGPSCGLGSFLGRVEEKKKFYCHSPDQPKRPDGIDGIIIHAPNNSDGAIDEIWPTLPRNYTPLCSLTVWYE